MHGGRAALSRLVAGVMAGVLVLTLLGVTPVSVSAAGMSGLHVSGNQLLNAQGQPVVLHGVDRSGTEYACINGDGIFDGPNTMNDDAVIAAMKPWGITGVNVSLNEDCWLGINGVPTAYGGSNYQNAIIHDVQTIEANGMYPVLALHWDASGTQQARDQSPMPDADHAPAFWQSVATTFKNDPAVIFRLKEEPYPAGNSDTTAAWKCWRDGGSACNEGYATVGMQPLVTTIRNTGAQNVIQVPGIQYANSMTQFLTYKPSDPLNNLMGVVDVYPTDNVCGSTSCYDANYAPVIAQLPFMVGEFGESVNGNVCSVTKSNELMNWLDAHHSGYFAWVWDIWGSACGDLSLITNYSGTPHSPNGTNYKGHLATLASAPAPSPAPVVSLSPTSLSFAGQVVNTTSAAQMVSVSNSGSAALTISSIGVTGTNAGDFAQTNSCPSGTATLAAGAKCTISVTFTPSATGTRTASVSIADNASGSPQSVSLSGTGSTAAAPGVALSPTSLTFTSQQTGTTGAAQTVTLTNNGSAALTINSISLGGTNAGDFAQTNTCPTGTNTLAAGANCAISVTFTPSATGTRTASLSIADNASGSPQSARLTGTGSSSTSTGGTTLVLYDNAVAGGFYDGSFSYASKNPCNTSKYTSGPCSYSVSYQAWGGISFAANSGSFDTSPYRTLEYNINPSGLPIGDFSAVVAYPDGSYTEVRLTSNMVAQTLANGWVHVSVPMSKLNPTNKPAESVQLKNYLGKSLKTIYLDDVNLAG